MDDLFYTRARRPQEMAQSQFLNDVTFRPNDPFEPRSLMNAQHPGGAIIPKPDYDSAYREAWGALPTYNEIMTRLGDDLGHSNAGEMLSPVLGDGGGQIVGAMANPTKWPTLAKMIGTELAYIPERANRVMDQIDRHNGDWGAIFEENPEHAVTIGLSAPVTGSVAHAAVGLPRNAVGSAGAKLSRAGDNAGAVVREVDETSGFYSPTLEAAKTLKQNKGTVEQMRAQLLKAGGKPKELEAIGFDEAFPDPKAKVTRQDVENFVRENQVRVRNISNTGEGVKFRDAFPQNENEFGPYAERLTVFGSPDSTAPGGVSRDGRFGHVAEAHFPEKPFAHRRTGDVVLDGDAPRRARFEGEFQSDYGRVFKKCGVKKDRKNADEISAEELQSIRASEQEKEAAYIAAMHTFFRPGMRERALDLRILDEQARKSKRRELSDIHRRLRNDPESEALQSERGVIEAGLPTLTPGDEAALTAAVTEAADALSAAHDNVRLNAGPGEGGIPWAPFIDNTSSWVDQQLKTALIDAQRDGIDELYFPNGALVKSYTNGTLEGQSGFYDGILQKRLRKVLKDIDPNARVETTNSDLAGTLDSPQDLYRVQIADEMRERISQGLPLFANPAPTALLAASGLADY
jgi:hypothetical protein